MSTLRDLKRQIRSIGNIKKITDAMERVAAARLKRAQKKAEGSRPYIQRMKKTVESLYDKNLRNPFYMEREAKKKSALIIVSSDRGLTGPYNSNIFIKAASLLQKYGQEEMELILFGRKAIDHYGSKKRPITETFREWGGKFTFDQVKVLTDLLIKRYLAGELDQIWLLYTHYVTVMTREVRLEEFLPISMPPSESTSKSDRIFEPNQEEVMEALLPRYCAARLYQFLQESYASELASRIVAMRSASKNSEELIDKLTLHHNKLRQSQITREMIEITAGAEAKG